jgi:hypothetical protein
MRRRAATFAAISLALGGCGGGSGSPKHLVGAEGGYELT